VEQQIAVPLGEFVRRVGNRGPCHRAFPRRLCENAVSSRLNGATEIIRALADAPYPGG
jgi:hypothetical protein